MRRLVRHMHDICAIHIRRKFLVVYWLGLSVTVRVRVRPTDGEWIFLFLFFSFLK